MSKKKRVKKAKVSIPPSLTLAPVDANPTFNRTFRFVASTATNNLVVSRGDLLNLLQMCLVTGTGTTGARVINSIKLRWLSIRPGLSYTTAFNTVALTWLGQYAKAKVETVSIMGSAASPELLTKPPKDSVAGFWAISGVDEAENVFSLDVTAGTVIDVNVSFVLQNFITLGLNPIVTTSTKAVTLGVMYVAAVDGTVSNVFTPVGALQW
jgi:hypothetical protein